MVWNGLVLSTEEVRIEILHPPGTNLGWLCGRPSPGPLCPRSGSKLQCRVGAAGVLLQGSKLLCAPLQGLSMEICISVVPPGMCCNKAHHNWTHSHSASAVTGLKAHPSHAPANELFDSAWTTSDTLGSLNTTIPSSLPGINHPGFNV